MASVASLLIGPTSLWPSSSPATTEEPARATVPAAGHHDGAESWGAAILGQGGGEKAEGDVG